MADGTNRYLKAVGITTVEEGRAAQTELSLHGGAAFLLSKSPAMAGAFVARKAYGWAAKKWPNHKRGVEFVGSVATVVVAYVLHVAVTKYAPRYMRLVDHVTDGMIGRIGPVLYNVLRSLLGMEPDPTTTGAAQGIDGDRAAIMDVASLMANSPETLEELGSRMYASMQADGVPIAPEAQEHIVRSLSQVTAQLAAGNF